MPLTSIDLPLVAKTISNKEPWMGGSMPASETKRKYAAHGIGPEHMNAGDLKSVAVETRSVDKKEAARPRPVAGASMPGLRFAATTG
jgi:hypothetical protein